MRYVAIKWKLWIWFSHLVNPIISDRHYCSANQIQSSANCALTLYMQNWLNKNMSIKNTCFHLLWFNLNSSLLDTNYRWYLFCTLIKPFYFCISAQFVAPFRKYCIALLFGYLNAQNLAACPPFFKLFLKLSELEMSHPWMKKPI